MKKKLCFRPLLFPLFLKANKLLNWAKQLRENEVKLMKKYSPEWVRTSDPESP